MVELPFFDYAGRMYGPQPPGHWTASLKASPFQHLAPGMRYVVSEAFTDFDGDVHAPGENWTFLGHSFLPHDDGLSLFVSLSDQSEWHIRLQWRADEQALVIDQLHRFFRPEA
jgi:hypothetical protein